MRSYMIPCDFPAGRIPYPLWVGEPVLDAHPMEQQAGWLARERGGQIPAEVLDAFAKLRAIATDNNVTFEELCDRALAEPAKDSADEAAPDGSQD